MPTSPSAIAPVHSEQEQITANLVAFTQGRKPARARRAVATGIAAAAAEVVGEVVGPAVPGEEGEEVAARVDAVAEGALVLHLG